MKAAKGKSGTRRPAPHQVRIIGGQWKRTPLPVADIDGLRPTTDRVRETVFNWISHQIGGDWHAMRCLDLFAGSGALGFEAASRGAAQVTLVETSPQACHHLQAVKEKLQAGQVRIVRGDALRLVQAMAERGQRFDIIFLDPPYQSDLLAKIMPRCVGLLANSGLVYAEAAQPFDRHDGEETPEFLAGWEIIRTDRAGMAFYCLLKR